MKFFKKNNKENEGTNSGFISAEEMRKLSEKYSMSKEEIALKQRETIMYLIQCNAERGGTDVYYDCENGTAPYVDYIDERIIEELRSNGYKVEYEDSSKTVICVSW